MINLSKTTKNFAVKRGMSIDTEESKDGQAFWIYADTHQEAECWIVFSNNSDGLHYKNHMIGKLPEDMLTWIKDESQLRGFMNELSKTEEFKAVRD